MCWPEPYIDSRFRLCVGQNHILTHGLDYVLARTIYTHGLDYVLARTTYIYIYIYIYIYGAYTECLADKSPNIRSCTVYITVLANPNYVLARTNMRTVYMIRYFWQENNVCACLVACRTSHCNLPWLPSFTPLSLSCTASELSSTSCCLIWW